MEILDGKVKGKLVAGLTLDIDDKIQLPPKTVGEILELGEDEYSKRISLLSVTKEMLIQDKDTLERTKDLTTFDILIGNCYYSMESRKQIIDYLEYFFNDDVGFLEQDLCFYIGEIEEDKVLNEGNYENFLECMRIQNKIDNSKAKKSNKPQSKKAKMLAEKRALGRKQLSTAKGTDDIKLADLLLNLSIYLGGNFQIANGLTLYQFYEVYQKFIRKERYEQNFDVYIAGGDPKQLDLDNHWTAKEIEKKEERPQTI